MRADQVQARALTANTRASDRDRSFEILKLPTQAFATNRQDVIVETLHRGNNFRAGVVIEYRLTRLVVQKPPNRFVFPRMGLQPN